MHLSRRDVRTCLVCAAASVVVIYSGVGTLRASEPTKAERDKLATLGGSIWESQSVSAHIAWNEEEVGNEVMFRMSKADSQTHRVCFCRLTELGGNGPREFGFRKQSTKPSQPGHVVIRTQSPMEWQAGSGGYGENYVGIGFWVGRLGSALNQKNAWLDLDILVVYVRKDRWETSQQLRNYCINLRMHYYRYFDHQWPGDRLEMTPD